MDFLTANLHILALLIAAGCAAGLLAGLFGVGGGLVVVPVVFFIMGGLGLEPAVAMPIAVATSLATIIPTASSSLRAHHRLGNVDWSIVRQIAPGLLAGVLLGSQLIAHLRTTAFVVFFGFFLLAIAVQMAWRGGARAYLPGLPGKWMQALVAATVGAISAVAGVGGGAIGVPLLTAASVPVHRAIGSCAAFGLLIAAAGTSSILITASRPPGAPPGTWKLFYIPAIVILLPLTVLLAPKGAAIGKKLSPQLLRRLFSLVLAATALRVLYAAWAE